MGFDASRLGEFAMWYLVFLISTTLHEFAHAFAAYRGGDETAYHGGQLTVDPLPHIRREPFGMVLVPVPTFFMAGWMMGWASVPFDPRWAGRHPKRAAVMAAAGPAINFALAIAAFIALKVLMAAGVFTAPDALSLSHLVSVVGGAEANPGLDALAIFLSVLLGLNVLLGLFNLIPVPPLDGAGIVRGLWPERAERLYAGFYSSPMASMLGLLVAWVIFDRIWLPVFRLVVQVLHPGLFG